MIDFDLNGDQLLLKDTLDRFVADTYTAGQRRAYRAEPGGFSRANWARLGELGVLALSISEAAGGLGGALIDLAIVAEALGKGLATEPYLAGVLASDLITADGSALAEQWLPSMAAGQRLVVVAHAGLAGGVIAEDSALDGSRLSGHVGFVEAAAGADALLVPATAGTDVSFFLVEAGSTGLSRRDYRIADGSLAAELLLENVPATHLAAEVAAPLARASVLASAELVGIMTLMFDATLDHLKTRRQFHRPLGHFQVIQHRMARLYLKLVQSRSLLYKAALSSAADADSFVRIAAGAKAYISGAATHLAHECVQFHGGMGITDELIIGHGHKRIMVLARLFSGPEEQLAL